jgi:hypothetical protein
MAIRRIEVLNGRFEPLRTRVGAEWVMRVTVDARNVQQRALPVRARVGPQPMRAVVTSPLGTGFVGFLERMPRDGDRLYVGYAGAGEIETSVVYRAPGVA